MTITQEIQEAVLDKEEAYRRRELQRLGGFHAPRLAERMARTVAWLPFHREKGYWPDDPNRWAHEAMERQLRNATTSHLSTQLHELADRIIDEVGPNPTQKQMVQVMKTTSNRSGQRGKTVLVSQDAASSQAP
ncbi:MAG: hypothetical protein VKI63_06040 [Cyanobium sp.]|nr:hypothetical protein [Cyanobium sp.]